MGISIERVCHILTEELNITSVETYFAEQDQLLFEWVKGVEASLGKMYRPKRRLY